MNFFDLLTNDNKMRPLQLTANENGGADIDPKFQTYREKMSNKINPEHLSLSEMLLGKQSQPTDSVDTSGNVINATVSDNPRIGGVIPDLLNGFKENYNNGFNLNNFGNNDLDFNRNKGIMYRTGEGLGTAGRFLSSELGRGLLTAGAVGLGGGSGLEALAYGTQAGALNNRLRGADQLYRQQLKNNYGYTDEDLQNIKGYISDSTYKNIADNAYKIKKLNQQSTLATMKDNTSRARMIGIWLKNGQITPTEATELISNYGITDADFQTSNDTRKTDSQIELNEAKIDNIKNPKPKINISYKYGNSTVNHNHNGGGNNTNKSTDKSGTPLGTQNNKIRIQGPDGNIYRVESNRVNEYIQAGGKVI